MSITKLVTRDFEVRFDMKDNGAYFTVYPIIRYSGDSFSEFSYLDKEDEQTHVDKFDKDKCFSKFNGSYFYRGVWEGRLYFSDEEYWGSDLEEMSSLYNEHIIPFIMYHINLK